MGHVYTIFHPATITPDLEQQFEAQTTVGNLKLIHMLDGKWILVPGVVWPDAVIADAPQEGESLEDYKTRMEPQIQALFDAGLPNGLAVNLEQLRMIKQSKQWQDAADLFVWSEA